MLNQLSGQKAASQEAEVAHQDIDANLNDITNEIEKGYSGLANYYNKFSSAGRQSRAYIDEKSLAIERKLADMVGKGTVSQKKFDYIVSKLPSSNASDATNRGRLKALSEEFKVELRNPKFKAEFEKAAGQSASGTTRVISPSGKLVEIPSDQLEAALASGGKRA